MKKYLPLILMVWPYLFGLYVTLPDGLDGNIYMVLLLAYIILTVLVYVLNIRNAFTYNGNDAALKLAFYNMIIKLIHIPFYLYVFAVGIVCIVAMVVPAFVFISPMIIMMLFFIDWFLMLTSSMYGIVKRGYDFKKSRFIIWHISLYICNRYNKCYPFV